MIFFLLFIVVSALQWGLFFSSVLLCLLFHICREEIWYKSSRHSAKQQRIGSGLYVSVQCDKDKKSPTDRVVAAALRADLKHDFSRLPFCPFESRRCLFTCTLFRVIAPEGAQ